MIPTPTARHLQSKGVQAQGAFGISQNDTAHIMGILRDTLYTDRILAVLREYSANAWDANREAGRGDVPIKVHLPTLLDPTISIRDNGLGLSEEDIFHVYTQYGASTKRETNSVVGVLGIGSKSFFCYTDSFTVTSWYEGKKCIYIATLDDSDIGVMHKVHEEPCPLEETGIEVKAAAKTQDIEEFHEKARMLFPFFSPRPEVNIDELYTPRTSYRYAHEFKNGAIYVPDGYYFKKECLARMGCISYKIDLSYIPEEKVFFSRFQTVLYLNIGEADIAANREELKYTEKTRTAILSRVKALVKELKKSLLCILDDSQKSSWEKRKITCTFANMFPPSYFFGYEKWGNYIIDISKTLYDKIEKEGEAPVWKRKKEYPFRLYPSFTRRRLEPSLSLRWHFDDFEHMCLFVQDTKESLNNFGFPPHSGSSPVIIFPQNKVSIKKVRESVEKFLKEIEMDGIPIVLLSTLPRKISPASVKRKEHYRIDAFVLKEDPCSYHEVFSDYWLPTGSLPQEDDVYLILSHFIPIDMSPPTHDEEVRRFYRRIGTYQTIAKQLGIPFPKIYGFKTTTSHVKNYGDFPGTPYPIWENTKFTKLLLEKSPVKLEVLAWRYFIDDYAMQRMVFSRKIQCPLGKTHFLNEIYQKVVKAVREERELTAAEKTLFELFDTIDYPAKKQIHALRGFVQARYPLLIRYGSLSRLWGLQGFGNDDIRKEWFDYIRGIDRVLGKPPPLPSLLENITKTKEKEGKNEKC